MYKIYGAMGTDQDCISATVLIANQDPCHMCCRHGEVWEVCVASDNERIIRVSEGMYIRKMWLHKRSLFLILFPNFVEISLQKCSVTIVSNVVILTCTLCVT